MAVALGRAVGLAAAVPLAAGVVPARGVVLIWTWAVGVIIVPACGALPSPPRGLDQQPDGQCGADEQRQQGAAVEGEGWQAAGRVEAGIADVLTVIVAVRPAATRTLLRGFLLAGEAG